MNKRSYRLDDYLKRIYWLSERKPVRAVDIAEDLQVTRPTVSVYLRQLQEDGYLTIGDHHTIHLTQKGLAIAEQANRRHQSIQCLLEMLGVPREIAAADACEVEHDLSVQSYEAIENFVKRRVDKSVK